MSQRKRPPGKGVDGEAAWWRPCEAAPGAKHLPMIVGWDIDTQVELVRETLVVMPVQAREFLVALLCRRRRLRVSVL